MKPDLSTEERKQKIKDMSWDYCISYFIMIINFIIIVAVCIFILKITDIL